MIVFWIEEIVQQEWLGLVRLGSRMCAESRTLPVVRKRLGVAASHSGMLMMTKVLRFGACISHRRPAITLTTRESIIPTASLELV